MRILPRINEDVNEEWISDKTRHVVDGLRAQRLDQPYVREAGRLRPASWSEAFGAIADKVRVSSGARIGAIAGDLAAVEDMFAMKELMTALGSSNIDCRQDGALIDPTWGRASYLFNATIAGIEKADALLMIGTNPRIEASVLNARIRKRWRAGKFAVGVIGEKADLTYDYTYLGAGSDSLADLLKHDFAETLRKAERPLIIVGQSIFTRPDAKALAASIAKAAVELGTVKDGWNGLSILHNAASRVGGLDIGFVPGAGGMRTGEMLAFGTMDVLFSLGADEIEIGPGPFVIYIGTHGDRGAHRADVILPSAAYSEKSAIYVNTEGRVQMANRAAFPPGEAREEWAILRALSAVLGHTLPYDSLAALRRALFKAYPHLQRLDAISAADPAALRQLASFEGKIEKASFKTPIEDFYLSNPIARASATMAQCSGLAEGAAALTAAE
jgi:NADH-quinone oxidoreductase subunit G